MKTVTGLLHIHTTYSYDGRITLDDISSIARSKGHGFLLLTEHSDDFSPRKMEALREHSQRLSDKDFVIIPGLEVNCDLGRHLLAVGVTRYISEEKP
ncbi:MAG TPA: PHP domain-containing protein, partial [Thermodesulfobacteriota bacterium]|nr:PHP domain-containing protein [Thermodesulfobacteriota bacterium]